MSREVTTALEYCSGCGANPVRGGARYCLVCGKSMGEAYQPLDTIRSAQHLHGKSFLVENAGRAPMLRLFEVNKNKYSELAWASCVYSMVPYIGVLFIPLTLILASVGAIVSVRHPLAGGWKLSWASFGLSILILGIQILLWVLLYIVPELQRGF